MVHPARMLKRYFTHLEHVHDDLLDNFHICSLTHPESLENILASVLNFVDLCDLT